MKKSLTIIAAQIITLITTLTVHAAIVDKPQINPSNLVEQHSLRTTVADEIFTIRYPDKTTTTPTPPIFIITNPNVEGPITPPSFSITTTLDSPVTTPVIDTQPEVTDDIMNPPQYILDKTDDIANPTQNKTSDISEDTHKSSGISKKPAGKPTNDSRPHTLASDEKIIVKAPVTKTTADTIFKAILRGDSLPVERFDINNDGVVDIWDVVYILMHLNH